MTATVVNTKTYTEATHTVYGDISGDPEPVATGGMIGYPGERGRRFRPQRITVVYHWRSHVDGPRWSAGLIEVSGRWLPGEDGEQQVGSGCVLVMPDAAPEWMRQFAADNAPTIELRDREGA